MAKGKQLNGHLLHSVAEPCSLRHLDAVGLGLAISVSSTFSVCFLESRMTATGREPSFMRLKAEATDARYQTYINLFLAECVAG